MFNTVLTKAGSFKGNEQETILRVENCKLSWRRRFHVIEARSGVWFGRTRKTTESVIKLAGNPTEIRKKQALDAAPNKTGCTNVY
jgi:hypothetical protein